MTAAIPELPDDIEALKAMVLAMAAQSARLEERSHHLEAVNKAADERIAALTAIVKMLERARYGRRSERLGEAGLDEVGYELTPLVDYVLERIKQAERIFADETTLPTLAPGSGKAKTA